MSTTAGAGTSPLDELQALVASRTPLIVVESNEEARLVQLARAASVKAGRGKGWAVFQWTVTEGLTRVDRDMGGSQKIFSDPQQLLKHLKASAMPGVYVLLDFHPYLENPLCVRLLKEIAQDYGKVERTIVLLSHELELPEELEHLAVQFDLAHPDAVEREQMLLRIAAEWGVTRGRRPPELDLQVLRQVVQGLAGLTGGDVERLARQAIFDDGALTESDLRTLLASKCKLLNRAGVLSYEPDTARFADIGGMKHLRRWIVQRKPAFDGGAPELDCPKGVMLLGVQGCGKSLAARAAAGLLGVPLLRLDVGALYSKWHGESERNLRESLASAEALAPCVLWIDEIEKALAGGDGSGDSGTSRRILGTFLTWLAEQRARVFVVATANDITALPPELVRKGRFDEIFFVDLPDGAARAEILQIHSAKRGLNFTAEHLAALAQRCDGYSGAEIEQAIVSALYAAKASGAKADASLVAEELKATRPLSIVLGERIAELRAWATERTVPAN